MKSSNRSKSPNGSVTRRIIALTLVCLLSPAGLVLAAGHASHREEGRAQHRATRGAPPAMALTGIAAFGDRPAPFALDARAAIMIDARSADVLYAYNQHERMQPASLAKMMTFYLTLEAL